VRKDIELCFGVLVQHFKMLQQPIQYWYLEDIVNILKCCVILHNMTGKVCSDFNTFTNLHDAVDNNNMAMEDNIPAVLLFSFQEENKFVDMAAEGDIAGCGHVRCYYRS